MSGSQSRLGLLARPAKYDIVQSIKDAVSSVSSALGTPLEYFGARPGELDPSTGVLRWQYSDTYDFFLGSRKDDDTKIGHVQFRTVIYTMSKPSKEFREYVTEYNHRRLHTLYNSGVYQGYMSGFEFISRDEHEEGPITAGQDEIPQTGLGVPNYSVEVYDEDGYIIGHSKGYSLDFGIHEREVSQPDAPQQEVWRLGDQRPSDKRYELRSPLGTQRSRAKNIGGKVVYINGMAVGRVSGERGNVFIANEHTAPSRAQWNSRKRVIESTGMPYQAFQPGVKFYKVRETPDALYFSSTKPRGWAARAVDAITPKDTGAISVEEVLDFDPDEPTTFVVTEDVADAWAMGKYDSGTDRDIDYETSFQLYQ